MGIQADSVAKLLEWFFENHSAQDIYAIPVAQDETTNGSGAVTYTQQISGLYGIFTNIVKDAHLSVTYRIDNAADYRGMPLNLLQVNVRLQYTLIGGGSNSNNLCDLMFNLDGQFGQTLLEYRFHGMDPVIVDKLFTLPKIEAIVADPAGSIVPEDAPLLYAMVTYLTKVTTDDNIEPVLQYVERFPTEYRVIFMRITLELRPNVMALLAFNSKLLEMAKMVY